MLGVITHNKFVIFSGQHFIFDHNFFETLIISCKRPSSRVIGVDDFLHLAISFWLAYKFLQHHIEKYGSDGEDDDEEDDIEDLCENDDDYWQYVI